MKARFIKYTTVASILLITSYSVFPQSVFAQTSIGCVVDERWCTIEGIISSSSGYIQTISVLAFLAMIIYGGYMYMTAGVNVEQVQKAKLVLSAAVIGFTIIVLAPLVVQIFGVILGVDTITN